MLEATRLHVDRGPAAAVFMEELKHRDVARHRPDVVSADGVRLVRLLGVAIACAWLYSANQFGGSAEVAPDRLAAIHERVQTLVQASGYACDVITAVEQTAIDLRGNTVQRVRCGDDGPDYRLIVSPKATEHVSPWSEM